MQRVERGLGIENEEERLLFFYLITFSKGYGMTVDAPLYTHCCFLFVFVYNKINTIFFGNVALPTRHILPIDETNKTHSGLCESGGRRFS